KLTMTFLSKYVRESFHLICHRVYESSSWFASISANVCHSLCFVLDVICMIPIFPDTFDDRHLWHGVIYCHCMTPHWRRSEKPSKVVSYFSPLPWRASKMPMN